MNTEFVYRYRTIDRLLGSSEELNNRSIYLASPDELNDPLEGFQDVVWNGDKILWENLLSHYVLILLWQISGLAISDAPLDTPIAASLTEDDLPTDSFRDIYHSALSRFHACDGVPSLPATLSNYRLRQHGLTLLCSVLHLTALSAVVSELRTRSLVGEGWSGLAKKPPKLEIEKILQPLAELGTDQEDVLEYSAMAANAVREKQDLAARLRSETDTPDRMEERKSYLIFGFPRLYVEAISRTLIHPNWHAACFSATATNSSMWASYAAGHSGAALMFRPERVANGTLLLDTTGATGVGRSGVIQGKLKTQLHPVGYRSALAPINFFEFLGTLPRPKLRKAWHSNREGAVSPLVIEMERDIDAWRQKLWKAFGVMATTKLEDWSFEQEYRIVLPDILGLRRENRILQFQLSQLVGIVFGIRTKPSDRLEIMRLLKDNEAVLSKDFSFYQTAHHPERRSLVVI